MSLPIYVSSLSPQEAGDVKRMATIAITVVFWASLIGLGFVGTKCFDSGPDSIQDLREECGAAPQRNC